MLNEEGRDFFISDLKKRINKNEAIKDLDVYKNIKDSAKDIKKIKMKIGLKKDETTTLTKDPVEENGFTTNFGFGKFKPESDAEEKKQIGKHNFTLTLPYAAFPEEANEKNGQLFADIMIEYFK